MYLPIYVLNTFANLRRLPNFSIRWLKFLPYEILVKNTEDVELDKTNIAVDFIGNIEKFSYKSDSISVFLILHFFWRCSFKFLIHI